MQAIISLFSDFSSKWVAGHPGVRGVMLGEARKMRRGWQWFICTK